MQDKLTFKQLSEVFSDEIENLVPTLIEEKEKSFESWKQYFKDLKTSNYDEVTKDFIKQVAKIIYFPVKEYNYLLQLKKLYSFYQNKKNGKEQEITEEIIKECKRIPIEELYQFEMRKASRNRITCKCPFHKERRPSFVIYRETNSFYCFSCKFSGDNITFIMRMNNLEFVPTIKYLKNLL